MVSSSLHIGLNALEPDHYAGWDGALNACEADMKQMTELARQSGFPSQIALATKSATRARVIAEIRHAATRAEPGDMFLISFSGHGGKVPDLQEIGDDGDDETWCLYDGQLLDDELLLLWNEFREGVRILIVSDSCHSGGIDRYGRTLDARFESARGRVRTAPSNVLRDTYYGNRDSYDKLQRDIRDAADGMSELQISHGLKASCTLLAACQDFELARENDFGGYFTSALMDVWDFGRFQGNYSNLLQSIMALIGVVQSPQLTIFGNPSGAFIGQKPFQI